MQLVAHGLPGDVIVRVRERFARTPLDLAGPRGLYVCVGLAIQAREQVGRKLRALGERQLHRVVQQLACAVGHNSSIPARRHAGGISWSRRPRATRSFAIYDRRSKLQQQRETQPKTVRPIVGELTRFEARLKKLRLRPAELREIANPFRELRLLWLDNNGLQFVDCVLLRLAQVVGFPLIERQIPPKRRERLRERFHGAAAKVGVPHPRDVYEAGWRTEAERVLAMLGVEAP